MSAARGNLWWQRRRRQRGASRDGDLSGLRRRAGLHRAPFFFSFLFFFFFAERESDASSAGEMCFRAAERFVIAGDGDAFCFAIGIGQLRFSGDFREGGWNWGGWVLGEGCWSLGLVTGKLRNFTLFVEVLT